MDVKVQIYNESLWHGTKNVQEWLDWVNSIKAKAPPDYQSVVVIEIESEGGYEGEHHIEVTAWYNRPETPVETQARADNEAYKKQLAESRLRAQYEDLKQRFG